MGRIKLEMLGDRGIEIESFPDEGSNRWAAKICDARTGNFICEATAPAEYAARKEARARALEIFEREAEEKKDSDQLDKE